MHHTINHAASKQTTGALLGIDARKGDEAISHEQHLLWRGDAHAGQG